MVKARAICICYVILTEKMTTMYSNIF